MKSLTITLLPRLAALLTALTLVSQPARAQTALTEMWIHHDASVVGVEDRAVQIVHDPQGDVIIAGTNGSDVLVVKYSGNDGELLWQQRYGVEGDWGNTVKDVAVDARGNVVIIGGWVTDWDYGAPYIGKLAATTGALMWRKRLFDSSQEWLILEGLAVDDRGNAIATGTIGGSELYTVKCRAEDGAVIWDRRYLPEGGTARARAVAVDNAGNVLVTATSERGNPSDPGYSYIMPTPPSMRRRTAR